MENITHIYDKIFKKVLTLSPPAVIGLINGLFGTDYPADSELTYNWTELESDSLKTVLADTIITVNHQVSYHTEAQMTKDGSIVFRMFEYGYRHADLNRWGVSDENEARLTFPEPRILYLYCSAPLPDEYTLVLDFGTQGTFRYKVPVVKLTDITTKELNERKMVVLLPFLLLKVRDAIQKERSPENIQALKNLLLNDIIGSIKENRKAGILTTEDAVLLEQYTEKLYHHLYAQYEEKGEIEHMMDHSFMTEAEIMIEQHRNNMAKLRKELEESNKEKEEANRQKEEANKQTEEANRQKEEANRQKEEANRQKEEATKQTEKANKHAAELQAENARLRALLQERELSDQK